LILPNLDRLDGEVVRRTKDKAFGKVSGSTLFKLRVSDSV
jgi:hypothetical protein